MMGHMAQVNCKLRVRQQRAAQVSRRGVYTQTDSTGGSTGPGRSLMVCDGLVFLAQRHLSTCIAEMITSSDVKSHK